MTENEALEAWIKTQPLPVSSIEEHGFINGYNWAKSRPVELTDFEIKGVLGLDECWVGEDCSIPDMIAFARAILRKAQSNE